MKIKYLGTAAAEGWPAFFCGCDNCGRAAAAGGRNIRSRSQAVINGDLLIDFPPDTLYHVYAGGLDLKKIRDIIITHSHSDHFYPQDLKRVLPPYAYASGGGKIYPIGVSANEKVIEALNLTGKFSDVLHTRTLTPHEPFETGAYRIAPLRANHDKKEVCLIFTIEELGSGKRILYGNDTGYFPEDTWEYLASAEAARGKFSLVSLDTTHGIMPHRDNHMGLATCAEVRARLIEIGAADDATRFFVNHFSHNGGAIYDEMVPAAAEVGFDVTYDGIEIEF